jgi:ribosome biogenesis GTPase A
MAINWYPGHMVKSKREIAENIKLVDIVLMLLDARAPFSCRNPDLERMISRKKIIFILNKMDRLPHRQPSNTCNASNRKATPAHLTQLRQRSQGSAAVD